MPRLTFAQAKIKLAKFISSQGPDDPEVADALNFVLERIMKSGQWKGNKFTAIFTPYDNQITAPAEVEAINALMAINPDGMRDVCYIQTDWYAFSENGRGVFPDDFFGTALAIRQGDGFCTYRDPSQPTTLVAYGALALDLTKTIRIFALDANGNQIWTDGKEGFDLQICNSDSVVASQTVTSIYRVIKPITSGAVFLFDVAENCVIASYQAQEIVPNYQRYNLVGHQPETRQYLAACTRAFIPLQNDNDVLTISNLNALRYGLQAYRYEDLADQTKAEASWANVFKCLNEEMEIFESDGTDIKIKVQRQCFTEGIRNLV